MGILHKQSSGMRQNGTNNEGFDKFNLNTKHCMQMTGR